MSRKTVEKILPSALAFQEFGKIRDFLPPEVIGVTLSLAWFMMDSWMASMGRGLCT